MTKFQIEINKKLLKIFILADIIEAEIEAIKPETTINNTETMLRLISLKGSCKRFRTRYDGNNEDFANKLGDITDVIDESINELSKDW